MSEPRLNRKLVLEAPQNAPDGAGGFLQTWVARGTIWADVALRSGREALESGGTVSRVGYKIIVRATPYGAPSRPMPDQRFRDGPRLYIIQAVAERDPEGRFLTCFAEEEVAV